MSKPNTVSMLALSFCLAICISLPATAQCFNRRSGTIKVATAMHACNNTETVPTGAQQCCNDDDNGTCGTDRLCKNSNGQYYVGGCTDVTYRDPVCRSECTWYRTTWIDWVAQEKQWHCCAVNDEGCNGTLQGETFNAVAPSLWEAVAATSASSASVSSPTSSATSVPAGSTFTPASTGSQQDNSLSQGAAIGVGVAVAIGSMAVLAAGIWFVRLYRRKRPAHDGESVDLMVRSPQVDEVQTAGGYSSELSTSGEPKELPARRSVRELPAGLL